MRDGFSREEARQVGARDVEGAQVRHGRQESGESGGRLVVVDGQEPVVVVCLRDVQVSAQERFVYTNIFKRSIGNKLSQLIIITLDTSFQMESISVSMSFESRKKPDLFLIC